MLSMFNWGAAVGGPTPSELPEIFTVPMSQSDFVEIEVQFIYAKILTDTLERMTGVNEKVQKVLWDNCLQSETNRGLVSLIAKSMAKKSELYLVYKSDLDTLREADTAEANLIKAAYRDGKQPPKGMVGLSFRNFRQADMIDFYSRLEFLSIASLYKSSNLSKAIQLKIKGLRQSTSLIDSQSAITQGSAIATALKNGKDVLIDGEDSIMTATPDVEATKASMEFLDGKRCFYLGMPMSYINGITGKGSLGDTGDADARAIERGLKWYYFSIFKAPMELIFGIKTDFKSEEFGQVSSAMEALKTFELVGEEYISKENKLLVVNRLLDLDSKLGEGQVVQTPVDQSAATVAPVDAGEKVADTAFNGAQVTALVDVVAAVNAGTLSTDSAINIIAVAFKVSEPEARKIVGSRVKPAPAKAVIPPAAV